MWCVHVIDKSSSRCSFRLPPIPVEQVLQQYSSSRCGYRVNKYGRNIHSRHTGPHVTFPLDTLGRRSSSCYPTPLGLSIDRPTIHLPRHFPSLRSSFLKAIPTTSITLEERPPIPTERAGRLTHGSAQAGCALIVCLLASVSRRFVGLGMFWLCPMKYAFQRE